MTKAIFTTGEAAKLCRVSQQTIIRCFDGGQIQGFRVPGSKFRRIPREALVAFMRANGIPAEALTAPLERVTQIDRELSALAAQARDLTAEREALTGAAPDGAEVVGPLKLVNRIEGLVEAG